MSIEATPLHFVIPGPHAVRNPESTHDHAPHQANHFVIPGPHAVRKPESTHNRARPQANGWIPDSAARFWDDGQGVMHDTSTGPQSTAITIPEPHHASNAKCPPHRPAIPTRCAESAPGKALINPSFRHSRESGNPVPSPQRFDLQRRWIPGSTAVEPRWPRNDDQNPRFPSATSFHVVIPGPNNASNAECHPHHCVIPGPHAVRNPESTHNRARPQANDWIPDSAARFRDDGQGVMRDPSTGQQLTIVGIPKPPPQDHQPTRARAT